MKETVRAQSEHIAPEILAALADPASSNWPDDRIAEHLGRCRRCMAVYAEFSRAHVRHALTSDANVVPEDLLDIGRAIATRMAPSRNAPDLRRRIRRAPAVAAVAATVACMLFAGWRGGWLERKQSVAPEVQRTISERLREDSYNGLLYSDVLVPRARGTRGPGAEGPADLAPLVRAFTAEGSSADVAYWLVAGLLAEGRRRDARPYLREAIARFPADARFHNLAAVLHYKDSRLADAERELQLALRIERAPAYLINLARVFEEQGRVADAAPLWSEVRTRHADAPVAALAREPVTP